MLPSESGYTNDSGKYGTYSPKGAEALLSAAGWQPGAGGIRTKGGQQLALTMLLQSGDSVGQSIAHLVQAMYQQVGVKLSLQTINQNDYFQNYVEEGNFQIGLWEWDDTPYPISGSQEVYQEPQGKKPVPELRGGRLAADRHAVQPGAR